MMRKFLGIAAALLLSPTAHAAGSIYDVQITPMKEGDNTTLTTLAPLKGRVVLVVNVASKCGFTKQYTGLQELYTKYKDQGLTVVGVPANDFGNQEPGTELEIVNFCKSKYSVTFPLAAKAVATGDQKAPIFAYLTSQPTDPTGEIKWNFEKFLIGRDGKVVGRWRSGTTPTSTELTTAIEKELAKK